MSARIDAPDAEFKINASGFSANAESRIALSREPKIGGEQTMKKVFSGLAVALSGITCGAMESWIRIDSTDILGGYTVYVDSTTAFRKQSMVNMWHLIDFKVVKSIERKSFLSLKGNEEYDCNGDRHRQLAFTWHSQAMGAGEVVLASHSPGDWLPVLPGSIGLSLWEFACQSEQKTIRQTECLWPPPTSRESSGVADAHRH